MATNISTVIIAKDEEDRIARCINSVKSFSDDIIVLDSGSTDGTIAIARKSGATVYEVEWEGYGPTKNKGNLYAKNDWILSIDADEYLSDKLQEEIEQLTLGSKHVYAINRRNFYLGTEIKHSGWNPDWVQRIFNRTAVKWNNNLVHEKLEIPSGVTLVRLNHVLNHDSYRSEEDHLSKIEQYAKLRAQIWIDKNKAPSVLKRVFGPFWKGFSSYILKFGFLDGKAGLIIAKMNVHLVNRQLQFYKELTNKES